MAFDADNLIRWTPNFSADFNFTPGNNLNGAQVWGYKNLLDTKADMMATGYFGGQGNTNPFGFTLGDIIYCIASDGAAVLTISTSRGASAFLVGTTANSSTEKNFLRTKADFETVPTAKLIDASSSVGQLFNSTSDGANMYLQAVKTAGYTTGSMANIYATPVQIVAPVAGHIILVHKAEFTIDATAGASTAGGVFGFQYDSTAHLGGVLCTGTLAAAAINALNGDVYAYSLDGVLGNATATAVTNKGIYMSNQTAAFATNPHDVSASVYYSLIPVV